MTALAVIEGLVILWETMAIISLVNQRHVIEQENAQLAKAWVEQFKKGK